MTPDNVASTRGIGEGFEYYLQPAFAQLIGDLDRLVVDLARTGIEKEKSNVRHAERYMHTVRRNLSACWCQSGPTLQ